VPEQELKPSDYDFIEIHSEIKKPSKVTKVKQAVQEKPKTKTGQRKRPLNDEVSNNNVQESATKSTKEAQAF